MLHLTKHVLSRKVLSLTKLKGMNRNPSAILLQYTFHLFHESKILRYFSHMRHDWADRENFTRLNCTISCSPDTLRVLLACICFYVFEHVLRIHGFRSTWPLVIVEKLATSVNNVYSSVIKCTCFCLLPRDYEAVRTRNALIQKLDCVTRSSMQFENPTQNEAMCNVSAHQLPWYLKFLTWVSRCFFERTSVYSCMCLRVCIFVSVCVCIYIYIYIYIFVPYLPLWIERVKRSILKRCSTGLISELSFSEIGCHTKGKE